MFSSRAILQFRVRSLAGNRSSSPSRAPALHAHTSRSPARMRAPDPAPGRPSSPPKQSGPPAVAGCSERRARSWSSTSVFRHRRQHWQPRTAARIHLELVSELGPRLFDVADSESVRRTVEEGIRDRLRQEAVLAHEDRQRLAAEIADDIFGYGPLERLLNDSSISEVMVNGCEDIWIERDGLISQTRLRFSDDSQLRRIITKMVGQIGRRIDESSPMVDARLPDGSRVNAIIPPLSLSGPLLTIRRFAKERFGMGELIGTGTLSRDAADFLSRGIEADLNMLISGGTGSGKTTMLNALSAAVPDSDRIVTIEDAAELQLKQRHVVRLESRPKNIEGEGEVTIRDLVRNSLRMRPDRIIVGEVRGAEALDMLQAMNTGHEGSLSTIHANSPRDALNRL